MKVVANGFQACRDGNYTCKNTQDSGHFGVINVRRGFRLNVTMRRIRRNTKGEPFHATCAIKDFKVNEVGRCIISCTNQRIIWILFNAKELLSNSTETRSGILYCNAIGSVVC